MKKLFLLLILLGCLVIAGKFGLEYYYKKKLDNLISQASLFADIKYRNLSIGFDGSVSIQGININARTTDADFRIKQIRVFSSDRLLPLKALKSFYQGEPPEFFGIKVDSLEYDPNIFEQADVVDTNNECLSIEHPIKYASLGINRLITDLELSVDLQQLSRSYLDLSSSDQTGDMNIALVFDASNISSGQIPTTMLPEKISFGYSLNEEVAEQLLNYCANKLNMSADQYLNTVINSPKYAQIQGIDFGADARQALAQVMQGGKWISIESSPSDGLNDLSNAQSSTLKDIIQSLNLTVAVDNTDVNLDIAQLEENTKQAAPAPTTKTEKTVVQNYQTRPGFNSTLTKEQQRRIRHKEKELELQKNDTRSYKTTTLSDAKRYINYNVIVKRDDKADIVGVLVGFSETGVLIEHSKHGGIATFDVASDDIAELTVYR